MPAVTVADPTILPRLTEPGLGDQARPVWQVTTAPSGYEGEGFPVRRAFAGIDMALLDRRIPAQCPLHRRPGVREPLAGQRGRHVEVPRPPGAEQLTRRPMRSTTTSG